MPVPCSTAVIFPGQGSQQVGMAVDVLESSQTARDHTNKASTICGFDLEDLLRHGPEDTLRQTDRAQPALLLAETLVWKALLERHPTFQAQMFAGHSLGEYTAWMAAGALSFSDAITLVTHRGRAMNNASGNNGGMLATLGLDHEQVRTLCPEGVFIANDNAPGQIIVAGPKHGLNELSERIRSTTRGRTRLLNVSAPFHCPLMQSSANLMQPRLESLAFDPPHTPVVANVTAQPEQDPSRIALLLTQQITAPVRWRETITTLVQSGVRRFIEIGPGTVLSGLIPRCLKALPDPPAITIEHLSSLDHLNAFCPHGPPDR